MGYKSYKMKKGTEYHEKKFKREEKRKVNIWVENEKWGIRGFVDYMEEKEGNTIIGDFKQKKPIKGKIRKHYKMQLVAEKMALEGIEKIEGVEIKLPKGERLKEEVTKSEEEKVKEAINEIRKIIKNELLSEEAVEKGKCTNCEYKLLCQPL